MLAEFLQVALAATPFVGCYGTIKFTEYLTDKKLASAEPTRIDGRTRREWYDLIRSIGPEATEELMLGPLDGLERDNDSAWNPVRLMGQLYWNMLEREWYPNEFCKDCDTRACKGDCIQGRARKAKELQDQRHLKMIEDNKRRLAQITQVKNLASNTNGFRITYRDIEYRLNLQEMKNFQTAHGLNPSGYVDIATRNKISECLKQGIPLKAVKADGIVWSVRQVRRGVVKLTGARNGYTASQEILFDNFADLVERVQGKIKDSLDKIESDTKARNVPDFTMSQLEDVIRKARKDLARISRDEMYYTRPKYYTDSKWNGKYFGEGDWMDRQW